MANLVMISTGPVTSSDIETLSINTIRTLAIDAIQKANSGHPGTPMGMAPVVYTLWQKQLRFDPGDAIWPNRDRFVLSAGHASMLLYSMLHLAQVKAVDPEYEILGHLAVTIDDIIEVWRRGSVVASWLLDLTAISLIQSPELKEFSGRVSDSGEGRWTIQAAVESRTPAPVLTAALYQRFTSRGEDEFAAKVLSAMRFQFGGQAEQKH